MRNFTIPTKWAKNRGSKKWPEIFTLAFLFHNIIVILRYINKELVGASKTHIFSVSQNELAQAAKVLAHPARIAILDYISKQENCICTDLVDVIGLAQPTISQHLNEIKKIGLIKGTFEGKNLCYCINQEKWKALQLYFNAFFSNINQNCC
jgi:DNA-binding transcriptional ArsR family regulator